MTINQLKGIIECGTREELYNHRPELMDLMSDLESAREIENELVMSLSVARTMIDLERSYNAS